MSFGATLREWRLDADLSQRELARRVGMDYTHLSKIEAGLVAPPGEYKIRALATALSRSLEEADGLVNLAQQARVPTDVVKAAVIRNPEVGALLRKIAERSNPRLTAQEAEMIRALTDVLDQGQKGE